MSELERTEWTSNFPTSLDDNTTMPKLKNYDDSVLPSQITAIRDASIALENDVGSNNEEAGSLRQRVTSLESGLGSSEIGDIFWQWNETDLSQFGTKDDGPGINSSAISVVTYAGLKWVSISITVTSTSLGYLYTATGLPINVTPPSADYGICAEFLAATAGNVGIWALLRYNGAGSAYGCKFQNMLGPGLPWRIQHVINYSTQFKELGDALDYPRLNTAYSGCCLGLYAQGETLIRQINQDRSIVYDSVSPLTVTGQPGIAVGSNNSIGTYTIYFRNIIAFTNLIKGK